MGLGDLLSGTNSIICELILYCSFSHYRILVLSLQNKIDAHIYI